MKKPRKADAKTERSVIVTIRFDSARLQEIDAAAKQMGIKRSAYINIAAANQLKKSI